MPPGAWKRREFCLQACRAASTVTIASALQGCGGGSPTAPSQPPPTNTTPPPGNPTPPPENPPPSNPPPSNPTPPPPSPIVSALPPVSATLVQGALAVTIDGSSPLATLWGAGLAQIVVDGIQRSVLLARIGDQSFTALNGVCTHEGCVVSRYATPIFVCPCHGSRYDTNGQVVQGPAPAALPRLLTEFTGGVLTVRL